ncbi:hypothetical protein PINS_up005680 [Pythium insidiosum]|nr:hypothetical protein PINS_up005680 [Pythium insidiosum]
MLSQYVLEAIHQHVLRNFVGATICSSNCLQVVRILEDRPQLSFVGARDGAFFLSGWRAMGHLQLEVHAPGGAGGASPERKRSQPMARSVAHDLSRLHFHGTPVVLEVTTKCLSPLDGATANPLASITITRPPTSGGTSAQDRAPVVSQVEFVCPIWRTLSITDRNNDGDDQDVVAMNRETHALDRAPEAYLSIASNLSLAQHAFSGSSLRVVVCPENADTIIG